MKTHSFYHIFLAFSSRLISFAPVHLQQNWPVGLQHRDPTGTTSWCKEHGLATIGTTQALVLHRDLA